ncbi:unnamed protein product [Parascedosporium putredinis]|uniref:Diphthamide biosynthesis protein 4 n=1 Tax=Parascedosporium putredinis TaxID=1442378 RepID=A0A9P1MCC6_9PEZI|nr:unnamed protein product [Parascedosporium putredinis]CAI7998139.1 unnamed protein product [Parascedosporium putredinis]
MDSSPQGSLPLLPSHYVVLAISPTLLTSAANPTSLLKQAYHRALLHNHPDKDRKRAEAACAYTIDQISAAYRTLSDPTARSAYDAALRLSNNPAVIGGSGIEGDPDAVFRTGVESVDLDDLNYDENSATWSRTCRCGNEKGFTFGELDLEEASEVSELVVGCSDCSLWLRVYFAVLEA